MATECYLPTPAFTLLPGTRGPAGDNHGCRVCLWSAQPVRLDTAAPGRLRCWDHTMKWGRPKLGTHACMHVSIKIHIHFPQKRAWCWIQGVYHTKDHKGASMSLLDNGRVFKKQVSGREDSCWWVRLGDKRKGRKNENSEVLSSRLGRNCLFMERHLRSFCLKLFAKGNPTHPPRRWLIYYLYHRLCYTYL